MPDDNQKYPHAKAVREAIKSQRHRWLQPFQALRDSFPSAGTVRRFAKYVDVDELKKIDDPNVIEQNFQELFDEMQRWANALERFDHEKQQVFTSGEGQQTRDSEGFPGCNLGKR